MVQQRDGGNTHSFAKNANEWAPGLLSDKGAET